MNWISNLIIRRAKWITLLGGLLAAVGAYYSVALYMNLRTDILELLPTTSRSVLDLEQVTGRLESIDNLAVLTFSENRAASRKFVTDLALKLEKTPRTVIASVEYKIDKELQFFKEHQALYMDLGDLIEIRDYIRHRIEYEKELYNPLNIFGNKELKEPHLDFLALRKKYDGRTSTFDQMPRGYYATRDEKIRAVLVNLPGKGIAAQKRLRAAVVQAIEELQPKSYSSDLTIKFTGGVEDSIEEQDALVEDLELSTVIVTVMVVFGMWFFFRSIRASAALMVSLFIGTFWTFGVAYYVVGYLNANSAFLGSIVIGNGINFGIIYLARYLEERRKGKTPAEATRISMSQTATSTWTAALAAGLSYGSLMLTGFRGFNQFGVIGLIGMVLCWISAYTTLPALLILIDRKKSLVRRKPPKAVFMNALAKGIGKAPKLVWGVSVFATLLAILSFVNLSRDILETDLNKLRNKESMTHGSAYLTKYIDEIFQRYLSPLVILPESRANTKKIALALKTIKDQKNPPTTLGSVQILDDLIPTEQEEKISILKQIKLLLPPRMLRRLSPEDQEKVQFLLDQKAFQKVTQNDLPPLVLQKFTEKNGTIGKMILVEPPLQNNLSTGENLIGFIDTLRKTADAIEPGAPVAGQLAVSSDMIRAITLDGPRATLSAFLAVVVLVILLFRNIKTVSLVLFALFLGVIWLAGIILGLHVKINFLNFIALPITFGIGVDYGVNIFQRYRETKAGDNILSVVKTTGSAVVLCSFATIVGYMSLLIAGNQGFVSFGILAVAGEITCVVAAVVSLPAFLTLRSRRQKS